MLSLAEPLLYDNLPVSYLYSTPGSAMVKRLTCYWLAPNTRKGYAAAISSYVSFYAVHNEKLWAAQTIMLEEWAVTRIFGNTLPKEGQIKPDAVLSYLWARKSYHINRRLSLGGFDGPRIALILKDGRTLSPARSETASQLQKRSSRKSWRRSFFQSRTSVWILLSR